VFEASWPSVWLCEIVKRALPRLALLWHDGASWQTAGGTCCVVPRICPSSCPADLPAYVYLPGILALGSTALTARVVSLHTTDDALIWLLRLQYYEVERLVARRWRGGRLEYLVHWKGYTDDERTWEPITNIGQDLLQEWDHILDAEMRNGAQESASFSRSPFLPTTVFVVFVLFALYLIWSS
jgi:hypothetical protein